MPIHEYFCKHCQLTFEKLFFSAGEVVYPCPHCGEDCTRIISQSTFQLKGMGWANDGYSTTDREHKN